MYDSQTGLIANYINPIIGDLEVQSITPRTVDMYIQTLQKTPCVSGNCQVKCKEKRKKISAGDFQERHLRGL